jgi:hypothetical protein
MDLDVVAVPHTGSLRPKTHRTDCTAHAWPRPLGVNWVRLALIALALGFVALGAEGLDIGPTEARLGLAAGEEAGPLGQVVGYWAPDLWPARVLPSLALARFEPRGRPTSAAVRWPSALAAILAGWLLARGMARTLGTRAAILLGFAWFGSLAVIDRSAGLGVDFLLGLPTLAAIDRLLSRGSDWIAGLWAALAFLAGGWPPLAVIGLALIVIGRPGSSFSARLLLPPLIAAIGWSAATIVAASAEVWAAALTLPLTSRPDWSLAWGVILLGLPWSPFGLLASSRALRGAWPADGRAWVAGWLQAALACLIAGTLVPGLSPAARAVALAGLLVGAAAGLEAAWAGTIGPAARRTFFLLFSALLATWLTAMISGCFLWNITMPYYRTLGVVMGVVVLAVTFLGWSTLATGNPRRGLITLILLAIGLKLVHWGYYAPEWNYRLSQGPWGRAIGQWVPRKWPLYTFHDWPADLAFFIGRPVRQLRSPRFLTYLPGSESRYVLLLTSEFDNWPLHAPPISPVARFQDPSGSERILARTPGRLPVPGQYPSSPRPE